MENTLLKMTTHESRTIGQPTLMLQPGWMQVTYSSCAQTLSISPMSRLSKAR